MVELSPLENIVAFHHKHGADDCVISTEIVFMIETFWHGMWLEFAPASSGNFFLINLFILIGG